VQTASERSRTNKADQVVSFHFLESRKDAEYNVNNHEINKSPKMIQIMYTLFHLRVNVFLSYLYVLGILGKNTSRDPLILRPPP
jgi:hypothetical protein